MLNFAESGHPVFRGSSALERDELNSKGKGVKTIHFNGSDETIEMILPAIISDNQFSIFGAVADLCKELVRDSSGAGKPPHMRIWNRWWYRQNFLLLTQFLRLIRKYNESCCVNTNRNSQNFLNNRNWPNFAPTLFFFEEYWQRTVLHDLMIWKHHVESTPYLEVTKHPAWEGGFVETRNTAQFWMWRSAIIKDLTVLRSWPNLYFETEQFLGFASWTKSTSTWPKRQKKILLQALPTFTLTFVSPLCHERKCTDVDPGKFNQGCYEVLKFMIRLLRHDDTVHREDGGAVRFDDPAENFKAKFDGTSQWPIEAGITFLAKGVGPKKRFQYCLNFNSSVLFVYFRTIQGHSGGTLVDPTLQDNVPLPDDFDEYNLPRRERARHALHNPGRIDSRRKVSRGQAVSVFHSSEPHVRQSRSGRNSKRSGQTQIYGVQIYLENSPKYSNLVQSEARSKKNSAVPSNPIARNRFFQHTTCDLYWETGIHEDWRGFILQSIPIPKVTAGRTHAKIAIWTSGTSSSQSEKIRRPSLRTKRAVQDVAHFSRIHVASIVQWKTRIARKQSKDWFNSSRITRTRTR